MSLKPLLVDYDEDRDVLYAFIGHPKPAFGVKVQEGVFLQYSAERNAELVGVRVMACERRFGVLTTLGKREFVTKLLTAAKPLWSVAT